MMGKDKFDCVFDLRIRYDRCNDMIKHEAISDFNRLTALVREEASAKTGLMCTVGRN